MCVNAEGKVVAYSSRQLKIHEALFVCVGDLFSNTMNQEQGNTKC
jgi:hypothetical protein